LRMQFAGARDAKEKQRACRDENAYQRTRAM